jgi:hypothetical protein
MVSAILGFKGPLRRKTDAFGRSRRRAFGGRSRGRGRSEKVSREAILLAAILASATTVSAAAAQTFGGPLIIEGPVYQRAIPIAPDAIFDALEAAGYREFSPMAPREPVYALKAVNPEGDLVALEISMFTGEIELELILAANYRPPLRAYRPTAAPQAAVPPPPPIAPAAPPPPAGGHDPLVVY